MGIFNEFNKKEKPVFTGSKFGFGLGPSGPTGPIPITASGGTKNTPGDGFIYHFFVGPGTFTVSSGSGNVRLLLLGGGGGGGTEQGCGGGAAACIYREEVPVTAQAYPITIGNGGSRGSPGGLNPGSNGADSTALGFTSDAGGGGGSRWHRGGSGGSSGGGTAYPPGGGGVTTGANPHPGGVDVESPPVGWGHGGGPTQEEPQRNRAGGGGAGAGGGGGRQSGTAGSQGGTGVGFTWISGNYGTPGPNGSARYFGGGGSGGGYNAPGAAGTTGGGGAGGGPNGGAGTAGTANTGSGGGGGGDSYGLGADGATGFCAIRYPV